MSQSSDTLLTTASTSRSDLPRLVAVSAALVLCLAGSLLGSGVLGGPAVAEAAGGALSADSTLLAPAGPAFTIWSVIYLGLAVYALWQWLPGQRHTAVHRRIGWWVVASMLLNAVWLLVVREGWLLASVVVIAVLAVVVGTVVALYADGGSTSRLDLLVTAGTFGLYAGWVSVATCANVAAYLVDLGIEPGLDVGERVAGVVLVVAGAVGLTLGLRTRGNVAVALAMSWGLAWIARGRLADEPGSTVTGVVAAVVAVVVLVGTVLVALRARRGTPAPA